MKFNDSRITTFQWCVCVWIQDCFGDATAADPVERNWRFLEESLELVQSLGGDRDDAHELVEYVFNRKRGDPHQEVGGVLVALAALCSANNLDMEIAAVDELERINDPQMINKIRLKHVRKPRRSPLPGDYKYSQNKGEV